MNSGAHLDRHSVLAFEGEEDVSSRHTGVTGGVGRDAISCHHSSWYPKFLLDAGDFLL
jgi:hypothetical protein